MRLVLTIGCTALVTAGVTFHATGLLHAQLPPKMTTVYLVLLKKGPAWTPESTPATQRIQEEHLAGIRRLWSEKKMIVAGPLENGEDVRGIFVLQAASLDAAKAMAAGDAAVKAGRLVPVVYEWWVERGVFPEAGSYCAPSKE
jgi:uncharacterized protein YciI